MYIVVYLCIKQFISIVINLLDALKTSFSHRSLTARSLGRRDTVSEAAIASISMLKVNLGHTHIFNDTNNTDNIVLIFLRRRTLMDYNYNCI